MRICAHALRALRASDMCVLTASKIAEIRAEFHALDTSRTLEILRPHTVYEYYNGVCATLRKEEPVPPSRRAKEQQDSFQQISSWRGADTADRGVYTFILLLQLLCRDQSRHCFQSPAALFWAHSRTDTITRLRIVSMEV